MQAPLPVNEAKRLQALHHYRILDTPVEEKFERLTRLAAQIFGLPIVLISLVDRERQWFKSCFGLDLRETSRGVSFCAHALLSDAVMMVPDATRDARFADNPLVTGWPGIRFYAGAPLVTPEGYKLGTLCLIDVEPRPPLSDEAQGTLADLAALVVDELELRLALGQAQEEISRRQEAEGKLRDANEALERANRAKSIFLANTSHELRTPLSAIIGFSELLSEQVFGPLNEQQGQYVQYIFDSGTHLLSLINDILDLSKVEAGKMDLEPEALDVPELVRSALPVIEERARHQGVRLELELPREGAPLQADRRKLKQALYNYLSNAVKFTPAGGLVRVRVEDGPGEVRFEVEDNGLGIAEEEQRNLFQAFSQLDSPGKKSEGTGLGLALTKRLVELHGGRVWVHSRPGLGSTFGFAIPRREAEAP